MASRRPAVRSACLNGWQCSRSMHCSMSGLGIEPRERSYKGLSNLNPIANLNPRSHHLTPAAPPLSLGSVLQMGSYWCQTGKNHLFSLPAGCSPARTTQSVDPPVPPHADPGPSCKLIHIYISSTAQSSMLLPMTSRWRAILEMPGLQKPY